MINLTFHMIRKYDILVTTLPATVQIENLSQFSATKPESLLSWIKYTHSIRILSSTLEEMPFEVTTFDALILAKELFWL